MSSRVAQRLRQLPPYLFARIDELKREALGKGADLIDLGIGDPDLPTPPHIVAELQRAGADGRHHRYPGYKGMAELRRAAADYYRARWGVSLDPDREVVALIGSKEGIAHFPLAFVDPGDLVLVPDPSYPVYGTGTLFAGGRVHLVPLLRQNGFLPDLEAIPADVARAAKVLWINYPNNPTAATAPLSFYRDLVEWARRNEVIIASDNAYADVYFDVADPPASILSVPGASELAIEFYSLSKTYNMTGWRVAFACGQADLVAGLAQVKTNVDSSVFEAVQRAGIAALSGDQACVSDMREVYRGRREALCGGLAAAGFDVLTPNATFYALVANPPGHTSMEFAARLLSEAHIVATPATGFGSCGEGFVRLTLCAPAERLTEAVQRMAKLTL
ncbi:MAG TPA: LL-diaminopimelate aminotransferase [Kofleriaceae bacterium]|nr:LL-diaminopimelate aminotransferase [Kofleriaceae bacterium]